VTIYSTVVRLCTTYLGVEGSWLDRAWFGVFPVGDSIDLDVLVAILQGWEKGIYSLAPPKTVCEW
jgi:hypothetical protein